MVGGVSLADIKTYKALIIKAMWYCRNKQTDQLNRITSPNQIHIFRDP